MKRKTKKKLKLDAKRLVILTPTDPRLPEVQGGVPASLNDWCTSIRSC